MDIWVEPSNLNAKKLYNALKEFSAPVDNLTIKELSTPGLIYVFGVPPIRIDILTKSREEFLKLHGVKKQK